MWHLCAARATVAAVNVTGRAPSDISLRPGLSSFALPSRPGLRLRNGDWHAPEKGPLLWGCHVSLKHLSVVVKSV